MLAYRLNPCSRESTLRTSQITSAQMTAAAPAAWPSARLQTLGNLLVTLLERPWPHMSHSPTGPSLKLAQQTWAPYEPSRVSWVRQGHPQPAMRARQRCSS